jgi:BON domain-containing protein
MRRLRRRVGIVLAMGAGAAAMYYLDPDRGRGRRARARDQLAARRRQVARERERAQRYEEGVERGLAHGTMPAHAPADDQALGDRVKSALGPRLHHDRVSLDVSDGVVELRGELDDAASIEELLLRVRAVPGVRSVVSLLHLPGQPAPNKAEALAASKRAEQPVTLPTGPA